MSRPLVLDTQCLIAFLEGDAGADRTATLFKTALNTGQPLLMSAVCWGELCSVLGRSYGMTAVERALQILQDLPIRVVAADRNDADLAARFRTHYGLSAAGCYAAALASLRQGALVTGDRAFEAVSAVIPVEWL